MYASNKLIVRQILKVCEFATDLRQVNSAFSHCARLKIPPFIQLRGGGGSELLLLTYAQVCSALCSFASLEILLLYNFGVEERENHNCSHTPKYAPHYTTSGGAAGNRFSWKLCDPFLTYLHCYSVCSCRWAVRRRKGWKERKRNNRCRVK